MAPLIQLNNNAPLTPDMIFVKFQKEKANYNSEKIKFQQKRQLLKQYFQPSNISFNANQDAFKIFYYIWILNGIAVIVSNIFSSKVFSNLVIFRNTMHAFRGQIPFR